MLDSLHIDELVLRLPLDEASGPEAAGRTAVEIATDVADRLAVALRGVEIAGRADWSTGRRDLSLRVSVAGPTSRPDLVQTIVDAILRELVGS